MRNDLFSVPFENRSHFGQHSLFPPQRLSVHLWKPGHDPSHHKEHVDIDKNNKKLVKGLRPGVVRRKGMFRILFISKVAQVLHYWINFKDWCTKTYMQERMYQYLVKFCHFVSGRMGCKCKFPHIGRKRHPHRWLVGVVETQACYDLSKQSTLPHNRKIHKTCDMSSKKHNYNEPLSV